MLNIYERCNQDLRGKIWNISRQQDGGREDGKREKQERKAMGKGEGHRKGRKERNHMFPWLVRVATSLHDPTVSWCPTPCVNGSEVTMRLFQVRLRFSGGNPETSWSHLHSKELSSSRCQWNGAPPDVENQRSLWEGGMDSRTEESL